MASWSEPPTPRKQQPSQRGDLLLSLGCIFACVAVWALTPEPGPAQPARTPLRAGLTAAGPAPAGAAADALPVGRRSGTPTVLALLLGVSLVVWLIADDLLDPSRTPDAEASEDVSPRKERERSAA
jgi:hypothetical protein